MTVEAGNGHGDLFVYPSGGDRPKVPTLSYSKQAQTVTTMVPIGRGGAITVENSGSSSRAVDVDVVGAYEPAALKGGRGYSTRRTPVTVVDTSRDLGLPKLGVQHTRTFSVATGVNRSAESVLLEVTARHAKQNTRLTFWRADQGFPGTTSLSVSAGAVVSGIVVASLTDHGRVRVRNSGGAGLDLKVTVLGSYR